MRRWRSKLGTPSIGRVDASTGTTGGAGSVPRVDACGSGGAAATGDVSAAAWLPQSAAKTNAVRA